jgi:hypothetical protein
MRPSAERTLHGSSGVSELDLPVHTCHNLHFLMLWWNFSVNMMKRSGGVFEDTSAAKKRPRQDPVSCQSCRKRKLKCDRKTPCSGCSTRRSECIYHNDHPSTAVAPSAPSGSVSEPAANNVAPSEPQSGPGACELDAPILSHPKDNSLETMDSLEMIVMGHWVPSAVPAALRADIVRDGQTDGSPGQEQPKTFGEQLNTVARDQITLRQNPADIDLSSYLPPEVEALSLFRYYCDYLDFHFHTIIPHHVEPQIEMIYETRSRQEAIDLNHAALLFSILASALQYKLQPEPSVPASAYSQAAVFLSGAALIQSNYMAYPTIEGLQATMIIVQNLSSTGLPPAVSSLFLPRFCINQAINMSLHLVDSPRMTRERSSGDIEQVSVELKRRIWWSLVSNDWLDIP